MGEVTGWRLLARWTAAALRIVVALVLFGYSVDPASADATRIVCAIYLSAGTVYFLLARRFGRSS